MNIENIDKIFDKNKFTIDLQINVYKRTGIQKWN